MWEMIDALSRSRNTSVLQQTNGALPGLLVRHRQVRLNGLRQLLAHGIQWIQGSQRVLKNSANFAATNAAHLVIVQIVNALALQQNLTTGHTPWWF